MLPLYGLNGIYHQIRPLHNIVAKQANPVR